MIIGLTGKNGSGKGAVAEILKARGFKYFSLSDALRDELISHNEPVTRENLISKGQLLRQMYGPGVLAERTLAKIEDGVDYAIDSFRHPAEVLIFKKINGFRLWSVAASDELRFKRCLKRAREQEAKTFAQFLEVEKKEFNSGDTQKQDMLGAVNMADTVIANNSDLDNLKKTVEGEVEKIKKA